jgi:hypothetical protein
MASRTIQIEVQRLESIKGNLWVIFKDLAFYEKLLSMCIEKEAIDLYILARGSDPRKRLVIKTLLDVTGTTAHEYVIDLTNQKLMERVKETLTRYNE